MPTKLEIGFLEEKTRPSVTKGTKRYKALTEQGLVYGKNVVNPRKPEETTSAYYTDTFTDIVSQDFRLADQTLSCLEGKIS